jgi:hypothetical protein
MINLKIFTLEYIYSIFTDLNLLFLYFKNQNYSRFLFQAKSFKKNFINFYLKN